MPVKRSFLKSRDTLLGNRRVNTYMISSYEVDTFPVRRYSSSAKEVVQISCMDGRCSTVAVSA